ncbi:unnamed protein product [Musa hybrid cultivar]
MVLESEWDPCGLSIKGRVVASQNHRCSHKTSGDAISLSRRQALPPRRYFLSRLCAATALNKAAAQRQGQRPSQAFARRCPQQCRRPQQLPTEGPTPPIAKTRKTLIRNFSREGAISLLLIWCMESSQSNIRDGSAGGSGGEGGDGGGGGGGDVAWLSSISEPELDFLISLKELIVRRAKTIGHKYLADKFDVKMLRALGIVLLEYFKEHAESACAPKLAETLALFNGCGSGTQPSHASMVVSESMQASSFMTPRRKRMWEGLCEEKPSSCKKLKMPKK